MNKAVVAIVALGLGMTAMAGQSGSRALAQDQPIYGSQLMTEQERSEYRAQMRAATTEQEREQIRIEHHREMQERARAMGVELPDQPPAMGMGRQGTGPGQGDGKGAGGAGSGRGG